MANEATLRVMRSPPIQMTCADGTGIEKGTLVKISDPRTVSATSADGNFFFGITAREKIANDGNTTVPVFIDGIFDITTVASPSTIVAGEPVKVGGANLINLADDSTVGNQFEVVGMALESVTATVQETIQVDIGRR